MSTWREDEDPLVEMYNSGYSDKEIADELGRTEKSVNSKIYNLKKDGAIGERGKDEESQENTTYKETDDTIHIVCASRRIKTKADVIDYFDIDTDIWKVDNFEIKTSEGYRKDRSVEWDVTDAKVTHGKVRDSGKMLIVPLVHTKTKFIRRDENDLSFEEIDKWFTGYTPPSPSKIKVKKGVKGGVVLEVCFGDIHVGNFVSNIEERCTIVIRDVVDQASHLDIEEVVLVLLGDTIHVDGVGLKTAGGTQLEAFMHPYEMFDKAMGIIMSMCSELASLAPVEIVGIYGNHDKTFSYGLFKSLEAYYRNVDGVTVDATHNKSKYRKYGRCLVLWSHGDIPKTRIKDLVYHEAREEFGATDHAEIHSGHIHHQQVLEQGGVILRYCPTITDSDEWHKTNGFIGNRRATQSFVWDKETGLKSIIMSGI